MAKKRSDSDAPPPDDDPKPPEGSGDGGTDKPEPEPTPGPSPDPEPAVPDADAATPAPAPADPATADAAEVFRLRADLDDARKALAQAQSQLVQDRDTWAEVRDSRRRIATLRAEEAQASEEAKEAKAALKAALEEHLLLEERLDSGQLPLPFGEPDAAAPPAAVTEPWRARPIGVLDLSAATLTKLHEAGVRTIGDLADWTAPPPQGKGRRIEDVPGIGRAAAEKIDAASTKFWETYALLDAGHPEADPPTEAEAEAPPEPDPLRATWLNAIPDIPVEAQVALGAKGLMTLRDLEDFVAAGRLLSDLAGVSDAVARAIHAAVAAFRAGRGRPAA